MGLTFGGGGEGFVEDGENEVDVCFGDAHRRFDAENVSEKATLADEETAFPASVSYTHLTLPTSDLV